MSEADLVVLIVEDEPLLRIDIVGEFAAHGWLVFHTESAEAALALTAQHDIDVLFTDIQLAGQLSGWDLAERLRIILPDLPIVYTSGNSADRSRRVEGSSFFDKPYDATKVVHACSAFCQVR
jgi:CheY-like chemotaxis protein